MPRLITLVFALLSAALFSQAPEFQQQYRQRLGGELDALTREVTRFGAEAAALGLSLSAAVDRLLHNGDELARGRGRAMAEMITRQDRLERQRRSFEADGVIGRLSALAADLDPELAAGTWRSFRPAVPTTLDGLAAALFGAGVGLFGVAGATLLWRLAGVRMRTAGAPGRS